MTPLRIAVVYPDLLGTYGDGGNGLILARRAEWRGLEVVLAQASSDAALPEADIYCLGGGEDGPQVRAARSLIEDGTLARRAAAGAVVLAVCAGYQIVGRTFPERTAPPTKAWACLTSIRRRGRDRVRSARSSGSRATSARCLADVDRIREPRWADHAGTRCDAPGPSDPWRWQRRRIGHRRRRVGPGDRHVPPRSAAGPQSGGG